MKRIEKIILVEASTAKDYSAKVTAAVEELQALRLTVEVEHSMSQAQKGVGYMYSAVAIGRPE